MRVDVRARYEFPLGAQTVTLRGRIENLANRDYWASAGGYPGSSYLTLSALAHRARTDLDGLRGHQHQLVALRTYHTLYCTTAPGKASRRSE